MLAGLSIRDVVLIERLELSFASGLTVLTGETGAGKSILLDALALALGSRAETGLVRQGAAQAMVTAEFQLPPAHPALQLLAEQDLPADPQLVIRRIVGLEGRSRGFVNDQPVSVGLLRRLAETLIEIHGQFDTNGLFDPRTHRLVLDSYGGLEELTGKVADAWRHWEAAETERARLIVEADAAQAEGNFLRDAVLELEHLAPLPGEEATLIEARQRLQHREKLLDGLSIAQRELAGDRGVELSLSMARRALERVADRAAGALDRIIANLDSAAIEIGEALAAVETEAALFDVEGPDLTTVDDRLFELRRVARRHGMDVDGLANLRDGLARRLANLDDRDSLIAAATQNTVEKRMAYVDVARSLTAARRRHAEQLDAAVARELKPLKLERAQFMTQVEPLDEREWGATGADRVAFAVSTNPGQPPGPLTRIASGGELARFMLALKVVMARAAAVPVLVFDEVDSGIGGATADAVGERLARLAESQQVLVVTHSPQVAARGDHHWQVRKSMRSGAMATDVIALDATGRREEIARMLSGAQITAEARAAASRLLDRPPVGTLL